MKPLEEIIKNDNIGTEYETKEVFGEEGFINEALGDKVRYVGLVGVFEGSNGLLMELKLWAKDFNIEDYNNDD